MFLHLATSGCDTVGEALDRLEAADPAERRALLDEARAAAGLPSIEAVEARERVETFNRTRVVEGPLRDARGRAPAICSAEGCSNVQPDPHGRGIAMLPVTRWWCAEHECSAAPGDLEPYTGPRLAFSPSGAIVDLDEQAAEAAKAAAQRERSRRVELEARQAERRADGRAA